ncbi:MAG: hypothetical protein RLY45_703 [Actinomycetota bacterium]
MTIDPDATDPSDDLDVHGTPSSGAPRPSASSTGASPSGRSGDDTSGSLERPAGPLTIRVSTSPRPADAPGRAQMPLAPKDAPKKRKRGDTGYQRAKKVKPIVANKSADSEAQPRSKALYVLVALLLASAGFAIYINNSEAPVAEESMVQALDGSTFQATDSFGIILIEGSALTVTFSAAVDGNGALGLSGGCNQISGGFRIVGGFADTVSFGGTLESTDGWTQTEMACDQPLMDLDAAMVDMLNNLPRLALVGTTLTMTISDPAVGLRSVTFSQVS